MLYKTSLGTATLFALISFEKSSVFTVQFTAETSILCLKINILEIFCLDIRKSCRNIFEILSGHYERMSRLPQSLSLGDIRAAWNDQSSSPVEFEVAAHVLLGFIKICKSNYKCIINAALSVRKRLLLLC